MDWERMQAGFPDENIEAGDLYMSLGRGAKIS